MTNKLFGILETDIEILKQIQAKLEEEYNDYVDYHDFDAIALLMAIKGLYL